MVTSLFKRTYGIYFIDVYQYRIGNRTLWIDVGRSRPEHRRGYCISTPEEAASAVVTLRQPSTAHQEGAFTVTVCNAHGDVEVSVGTHDCSCFVLSQQDALKLAAVIQSVEL
jgi:hypothetical protein